ncbi:M20/M25/M40 family metallo-hydrolase [Breznakia pachnodae]|uniref:Tripeptide aminopeptidase n=1 Tax=Breznakia pachnodae TaxID=265178 RepID=A0ABU0E8U5_9FIRM|nr:M20/M25/M40 family metallo-hydrolase [Breznakia pachnodae]MDQ0363312.1 tripeptide aminopeptidase [Breznakia pachnodae]
MKTERMIKNFEDMVKIDSTSRKEGKYHEYLKKIFKDLGCSLYEDNISKTTGLGGNNLLFKFPGDARYDSIFFSCHTDTVSPGENIETQIKNDIIYSLGDTILAADDKAGIAAIIESLHILKENNIPHGPVEVVLSPGEEIGLLGSKEFDTNQLKSQYGFILDGAGKVGIITVASPTLMKLNIKVYGKAAHAGVEPEKGIPAINMVAEAISKIPSGRLDDKTTLNFGTIHGGVATNIVSEEVTVEMEIRSISHETCLTKEKEVITVFEQVVHSWGGKLEIESQLLSRGYEFSKDDKVVQLATIAIKNIGRDAHFEISGGASDANSFNEKGKECVTLSIGYEKIHTTEEFIPIEEMEATVKLLLALIENKVEDGNEIN